MVKLECDGIIYLILLRTVEVVYDCPLTRLICHWTLAASWCRRVTPGLDSTCIHIHCFTWNIYEPRQITLAYRFKWSQSEKKPYLIQGTKPVYPPVLITKSWNRNWNFLVALPPSLTVAAMDGPNKFHWDLNLHMAMCTNDCRALHKLLSPQAPEL